jgi:hypothetical protein
MNKITIYFIVLMVINISLISWSYYNNLPWMLYFMALIVCCVGIILYGREEK